MDDPVDLVLVESGGDNLTATFSPALVDRQIFVIDVAGGGDVARKGGPGIERADLLVIGSRGYRFMRRLLLGGVAGALMRNARYPVVIVPGPE